MSPVSKTAFDYTALEETVRSQLKTILTTIRRNSRSSTKAIQTIGMALLDAKQHLEHGQLRAWILSQCGFSMRTAERYMRSAEVFEDKYDIVSHLQPSTIYRLSAKSMSADIVGQVLARLGDDSAFSDVDVNALIDQLVLLTRPTPVEPLDQETNFHLREVWLAASPADRLALLNSDPMGFVRGAWQFMHADDRAHFFNDCHDEIASWSNHASHRSHITRDPSEPEQNVVQLFSGTGADRECA